MKDKTFEYRVPDGGASWIRVPGGLEAGHYVVEDAGGEILPIVRQFLERPD